MFLDAVDCYDAFRRISEGKPKARGTDKEPEDPVFVATTNTVPVEKPVARWRKTRGDTQKANKHRPHEKGGTK